MTRLVLLHGATLLILEQDDRPRRPRVARRPAPEAPTDWATFDAVWEAYPEAKRVSYPGAKKAWKELALADGKPVLDALQAHLESEQWKADRGQYVPSLIRWLRERRWELALPKWRNVHEED